jgi:hypothetical protein
MRNITGALSLDDHLLLSCQDSDRPSVTCRTVVRLPSRCGHPPRRAMHKSACQSSNLQHACMRHLKFKDQQRYSICGSVYMC